MRLTQRTVLPIVARLASAGFRFPTDVIVLAFRMRHATITYTTRPGGRTASYRTFATPRELERLLADDLAVLLSEHFAGAGGGVELPAGTVTFVLTDIAEIQRYDVPVLVP